MSSSWIKTNISKTEVENIQKKYSIDSLTASIFARRGITKGKDILYYMEDDLRFQHNPFLFNSMEDVVERILDAVPEPNTPPEEKEKVLIFGDKDVDGVTATTVLYEYLCSIGINVQFKVPQGDDAYGLSIEAIDEFAKQYGSLIITVDCGIANNAEIAYAAKLGIDVIVLDHHNPQEELPAPATIINAKIKDSGYPFEDISGCAVAYKVVSALRFSKSKWFKSDITLLNTRTEDNSIVIECIKTKNLIPVSRLVEYVNPDESSINQTKLPKYLHGQIIFCWDKKNVSFLLSQAFGPGIQFNLIDIQTEVAKLYPSMANMPLAKVKYLSKLAKYGDHEPTELGGFYNIFVTYVQQCLKKEFPNDVIAEENDLQLVTLAALADVMPMKNENRLFVKKGLKLINSGKIRPGLLELMSCLNLLGKRLTSTDLSWTLVPNLNAAGRLGKASIAVDLFTVKNREYREKIARQIIKLNEERKQLTQEAENFTFEQAKNSVSSFNNKLCFVFDERINKGVQGILAGRFVNMLKVPSIVMTKVDNVIVGSIRSCRNYDVTKFLEPLKDLFISHGGHNFAAGFTLEKEKFEELKKRIENISCNIQLEKTNEEIFIDAEIPLSYMTPKLQEIVDRFEPYGNENSKLLFMSKNLPLIAGSVIGKTERQHLKATVDCGSTKWPCVFWNEGSRLNKDFKVGDKVDILFNVERNLFNGIESLQLMLYGIEKSK